MHDLAICKAFLNTESVCPSYQKGWQHFAHPPWGIPATAVNVSPNTVTDAWQTFTHRTEDNPNGPLRHQSLRDSGQLPAVFCWYPWALPHVGWKGKEQLWKSRPWPGVAHSSLCTVEDFITPPHLTARQAGKCRPAVPRKRGNKPK